MFVFVCLFVILARPLDLDVGMYGLLVVYVACIKRSRNFTRYPNNILPVRSLAEYIPVQNTLYPSFWFSWKIRDYSIFSIVHIATAEARVVWPFSRQNQ